MASKKVIWFIVGLGGVVLLAGAGLIAVVTYSIFQHLEVRSMSSASAEQEYEQVRSRLVNRAPLVEIDSDNWDSIRVNRPPEQSDSKPLTTLRILAWDPRDAKLARFELPFWLLRLNLRGHPVNWQWNQHLRLENLKLTTEDLERHGPGLVLDFQGRRGERVLVWSD
jgi:hypothetical protein